MLEALTEEEKDLVESYLADHPEARTHVHALQADASRARGDARDQLLERIGSIDDALVEAAVQSLDPATRLSIEKEAESELTPFRSRMAADAYILSRRAAIQRLVRQHFGLPSL